MSKKTSPWSRLIILVMIFFALACRMGKELFPVTTASSQPTGDRQPPVSSPIPFTPASSGGEASPSTPFLQGEEGRTFYVSPAGDNANPGTRQQPWRTPGFASRQLSPGDTLMIHGGRYVLSEYDADILTPPSGRADAWITIRGDTNPEVTSWSAIVIAPEEQPNTSFEIVNVTVDDALGQNYLMQVQYDYPQVPTSITIRNTIFSGRGRNSPLYLSPASLFAIDHTLFYFPQTESPLVHGDTSYTCDQLSALGDANLCGNPLFVKPAWGETGDYHLQADSPAINTGTSTAAPTVDLENRPRDAFPDLGAYEFWSASAWRFLPLVMGKLLQ